MTYERGVREDDPYEGPLTRQLALAHAVDRSEYVRFDEEQSVLYCWNGSLTVNVIALDGQTVDMWTLGQSGDEPRDELRDVALRQIAEAIGKEDD